MGFVKQYTTKKTADQYQVKEHNLSLLLEGIWFAHRPISRSELRKLSGLNQMTICNLVAQLEEWQMVTETGVYQPRRSGRPGLLYEINPDAGLIIGVEIGVGIIYAVLANFSGEILWSAKQKTVPEAENVFIQAQELVTAAIVEAGAYSTRVLGIGAAVAALVSNEGAITVYPGSLSSVNASEAADWQEKFDLPVFITNDGNASVVGEQLFGETPGFEDDILFINVGDGLGAGIISNGTLYSGAGGFAGEIGHMTIEADGTPCKCGNRGCWENYVSLQTTMQRWVSHPDFHAADYDGRFSGNPDEDYRLVVDAAQAGDNAAMFALRETGRYLGIGLASAVNIFNPSYIFLGGQLCLGAPYFMQSLMDEMDKRCFSVARANVRQVAVVQNPLDIAVLGAVGLVIRDVLHSPWRWQPAEVWKGGRLN